MCEGIDVVKVIVGDVQQNREFLVVHPKHLVGSDAMLAAQLKFKTFDFLEYAVRVVRGTIMEADDVLPEDEGLFFHGCSFRCEPVEWDWNVLEI